jgi:large subunit ribosomal protein L6
MSRIGQKPIPVPDGVKVAVDGQTVSVQGPLGKLAWTLPPEIAAQANPGDATVVVTRRDDSRRCRSLHGLSRSLIANMVQGCATGFSKSLEVYGVGYGVQVQGKRLLVNCGRSHPVAMEIPEGIEIDVEAAQARGDAAPARFTVRGPDKQAVGEFAARVRRARPPEPYKGKGVRYAGERVRRKVGKAFAGGAT